MALKRWILAYALVAGTFGAYGQEDHTQCASNQLDWYEDAVGETPCVTYQRLRQICNSDYRVGEFRSLTPGDNCDDQVSACCCNTIAWSLSMLCFNCQYAEANQPNGIDAGAGGADIYLATCRDRTKDKELRSDIQQAVCNKEIKLDRTLYNLFWSDGAWFYTYFKQTMQKDLAVTNNNTFTKCASTTRNETDTTSLGPSSTESSAGATGTDSSSNASSSRTNLAPIIGGAVGGVIALLAIAGGLLFCFWKRLRRQRGPKPLDLSTEYNNRRRYSDDPPQMGAVTPFTAPPSTHSRGYGAPSESSADPESHALLPRGPTSAGSTSEFGPSGSSSASTRPSKFRAPPSYGGYPLSSPEPESELDADRHEDAGPAPHLQRSASGRLPPAYRRSWDATDAAPPLVEVAESETQQGSSSYSGQAEQVRPLPIPQQYPRDVKAPLHVVSGQEVPS
ncbi:hypothetical protein C8Q76DRAFT_762999 [Earliella scabrosa]|nr:hypothetical protein C8Q76DRAFT_762999 [Earliella scabrosa]